MASELAANSFDLVVIGAGPAGEKAAAQAAYFGKRVAIVELAPAPGGAAVHTGTLPSKTLRETAVYLSGYHMRELYGVSVELEKGARLHTLMARKDAIAQSEAEHFSQNLRRHGVSYFQGRARIVDPHVVEIAETNQRLSGEFLLIATGSRPHQPPEIDFTDSKIHDSDEILHIHELPESMLVLGAGVIGCEYACMFAALGVRVTLVDARAELLQFLDLELVERLKLAMQRLGVTLVLGAAWKSVKREAQQVRVVLSDAREFLCDQLLFAAGRIGNSANLGLENIGIVPDKRGNIPVDAQYRTCVPHVLAVGDVIGFPALASASMEQGRVAVCHAFEFAYKQNMAACIPYGIYTIPEVSGYGETEESCKSKGIDYVAGRALYLHNARGKITGDLEGMTKLIVERPTRRLLGVHVIGERATELVHIGQAVAHLHGSVDAFIEMVFNYPTLAESYKYAAYACLAQLG